MASPQNTPESNWWEPVWELVIHVLVGSLLFAVIVVPAVALDLAVAWMKKALGPSEFIVGLLTVIKYIIAIIDAILYVAFMCSMGWHFLVKIWRPRH